MGASAFSTGLRPDGLPAALSYPARLAAVAATGLLDTGAQEPFDDLARPAAAATGCARAFITLVDEHRSFWKSCIGVDEAAAAERGTAVRESFCYFLADVGGAPFVVEDAAADPRTRDHPSVRPMKIGAWAGYPLLSPDGQALGSMCVIDQNPHAWQPEELTVLATLARAVGNEINLRNSLSAARTALSAPHEGPMMFGFRRGARAAQSPLIAHGRAMGVAEAVVRRAWAEELLRRSDHTDFAVRAAKQGREAAYRRLAAAQLDGDPRKISLAHAWLERALDAERISALDRIRVRQTLSAELDLLARMARERSASAQAPELEQRESVITAEPRERERDVQAPLREPRVRRWLARCRVRRCAGCEQP